MSDTACASVENEAEEVPEQACLEDKPQKPLNVIIV